MENNIEIKHLSREDKLRVMEAIWEDLLQDDHGIESPGWHKDVLEATSKRLNTGEEKVVDWSTAKKDLRKKFE